MNDETVIIERRCGTCFFFHPQAAPIAANNGTPGDADIVQGPCFYNPPTPYLVQQQNRISGAVATGTTSLSPIVSHDRKPCAGWCPEDMDPFGDTDEGADQYVNTHGPE